MSASASRFYWGDPRLFDPKDCPSAFFLHCPPPACCGAMALRLRCPLVRLPNPAQISPIKTVKGG
jgi:hypothetical protein